MAQRPYLRVGAGLQAGRVVTARGRGQLCLSGPAVQTGVPFECGGQVRLRVQVRDEVGRVEEAASSPPHPRWNSGDLMVVVEEEEKDGQQQQQGEELLLQMTRPVLIPRVRFEGWAVVAFQLRRFQFEKAPPFPPRQRIVHRELESGVLLAYDRTGSERLLWRLSGAYWVEHFTWDGRHVWIRMPLHFELRRLADGALMVKIVTLAGPGCGVSSYWLIGERTFASGEACLMQELDDRTGVLRRFPCATWLSPGVGYLSPAGDRQVTQDPNTCEFWERTRRDGFSRARLLCVPLSPADEEVNFKVTAAGEVVWSQGDTLYVWKEGCGPPRTFDGAKVTHLDNSCFVRVFCGGKLAYWR